MSFRSDKTLCWLLLILLLAGWGEGVQAGEDGKALYRRHCIGCHYWHGEGGGGYGGPAASLRATRLDHTGIAAVIRCGLPGTGMPYHDRQAYQDNRCTLPVDLATPPRADEFLRAAEVEAVAAYIQAQIQGRAAPTAAECRAFWGEEARQCRTFDAAAGP